MPIYSFSYPNPNPVQGHDELVPISRRNNKQEEGYALHRSLSYQRHKTTMHSDTLKENLKSLVLPLHACFRLKRKATRLYVRFLCEFWCLVLYFFIIYFEYVVFYKSRHFFFNLVMLINLFSY